MVVGQAQLQRKDIVLTRNCSKKASIGRRLWKGLKGTARLAVRPQSLFLYAALLVSLNSTPLFSQQKGKEIEIVESDDTTAARDDAQVKKLFSDSNSVVQSVLLKDGDSVSYYISDNAVAQLLVSEGRTVWKTFAFSKSRLLCFAVSEDGEFAAVTEDRILHGDHLGLRSNSLERWTDRYGKVGKDAQVRFEGDEVVISSWNGCELYIYPGIPRSEQFVKPKIRDVKI